MPPTQETARIHTDLSKALASNANGLRPQALYRGEQVIIRVGLLGSQQLTALNLSPTPQHRGRRFAVAVLISPTGTILDGHLLPPGFLDQIPGDPTDRNSARDEAALIYLLEQELVERLSATT